MPQRTLEDRLGEIVSLVLEIAGGNYGARLEPTDRGDAMDAVAVGLNLTAESLALEHARRKHAEALLADAVRAYDEAPAMFCTLELENFEIVKCNLTLANVLGIERDHLLQRRLLGFLPTYEREVAAHCLRAIAAGHVADQTTFHLRNGDGTHIPVLISGSPIDPSTGSFRLVLRDVSQEHLLAARLQKAQKLEVVGRLASGVAHDFNNTLQVIVGAAALLASDLAEDHPGRRELDAILSAAELGSGLTRQLLALSRPLPDRAIPQRDLNQALLSSEPLLKRALGPYNELVMALADAEFPVRVSQGELAQVLINLAINGRDAMPTQGVFTIRTQAEGTEGVTLEVEDNGVGIAPELIEHVLEPFVTTKSDSGGTGLGLAVCKRIVESWGGTVTLHSTLGVGTRIALRLPLDVGSPTSAEERAAALAEEHRGWNVLIVDDEPMVRSLIARAVEAAGHEVQSADGLPMALELVSGMGHLDALITDVVMPTGSGVELAEALWEKHPDLPVVFMSGYTGNAVQSEVLAKPNVAFLAKPFMPPRLLELLEALEVGAHSPR